MDKLSYHNWKRYWLQLCRLLLIFTTICLTSAVLLIIFNVIANVNGNVDYRERPQQQPFVRTHVQRSHSADAEIIVINKNREKREAPAAHDHNGRAGPSPAVAAATPVPAMFAVASATAPPLIATGTNQLVPTVAGDRNQRDLPIVSNQLIVNRYSVNRNVNVRPPYWMVQQNSTLDSNANVTTSIRLISHQRLQQPTTSTALSSMQTVQKTGGRAEPRRRPAFRKNVLNNGGSLPPRTHGGASNRNRNQHRQHVLPTKQYELDNGNNNMQRLKGNSEASKSIHTNSNSNSKPKNSIKVVKSNLSKEIIEGYGVATAASEMHIIKAIDDPSSIDVLRSSERNDANVRGDGSSGTDGEGRRHNNKKICAPCRVIPGQPTRRINIPVTTRPWAWNRECRCNPYGSTGRTCHRNTGNCFCRSNVIGRACDRCLDGYWNLETGTGCQSCDCNAGGSRDGNCSAYTGQCNCKVGVVGIKCDQCSDGFYGFSNNGCKRCDTCSSLAYNCDPDTGRCVCPALSKGVDCQQCYPNSWGWEHKIGCKLCDCDLTGSIGQSCDLYSGQCVCREGFTGPRCDICLAGYYDHPNCKRCNCNRHGSVLASSNATAICDQQGQCECKPLVTGQKCDQCASSTFGLSHHNPDGCTRCFCFGRSEQCQQSQFTWGQIRAPSARNLSVEYLPQSYVVVIKSEGTEMNREDAEIKVLNNLHLIPSSMGNVSIGTPKGFDVPLYFQLPPQFFGDRISSYSGYIRYSILTQGCETVLHANVLKGFPLVQIYSHAKLIIDYYGSESNDALPNDTYAIQLKEGHWRHHFTGENVSRSIFMAALQNIKHIFLRGTTWLDFTQVVITNVTMDTGIYLAGSKNNLALGVETCQCANAYSGSSCQDPAEGYFRWTEITITETEEYSYEQYVGKSMPCNCNGRSLSCNRETGHCEGCQKNTGGPNCEQCAEGFYGNPFDSNGCQSCPCPETSKNFAKGCTFQKNRVSCICKPGYTGDFCEQCSLGYFGIPDNEGGQCTECDCDPNGIVSNECDELTGQCNCKAGITGRRCEKCVAAKHILEDGLCRVCDNCTLTLLESTDELGQLFEYEVRHIDLNGIPAPWPRLLNFENMSVWFENRLDDYSDARDRLENFNEAAIEKLHSKAANEEKHLKKLLSKMKKYHESGTLKGKAEIFLEKMQQYHADTQTTILALNQYGTHAHHINLHLALGEAQQLLNDIKTVSSRSEHAKQSLQCANDSLNFWSTMSELTSQQVIEASELKFYGINTKHRINDAIQLAHRTFDTLTKAESILSQNRRRYDQLLFNHKRMYGLKTAVHDIYNNSIIPQTDTTFELIDDNYSKIGQHLDNIHRLKKYVHDVNEDCAEGLKYIRLNYLQAVQRHADNLMHRAREYAKLFQHSKNGAEVALLASSAHRNISNAIESARVSAIETIEAVAKSEEELYPTNGESVIAKGLHSLRKSQKIEEDAIKELNKIQGLFY